jgi:6-phosphogluconolactonase
MAEIRTYGDAHQLARAAAEHFVSAAAKAIAERGRFAVALSGGSTPRSVYALLGAEEFSGQVDWDRAHLFWGDERCVPPHHPDSNFKAVAETLLKSVSIPAGNVHRMPGEEDPSEAARDYETMLRAFFAGHQGRNEVAGEVSGEDPLPHFDLLFLGLGLDGHTASLFPSSSALGERRRWVVANYVDELRAWRLTLTPKIINAAGQVTFLVSGGRKGEILRDVLLGPHRPDDFPAQLIKPARGRLLWMIDGPAGELLE